MHENMVEAVNEKPNEFPIDLLLHCADEAWASLQRSAAMRRTNPEEAISAAIGLLEAVETAKQNGVGLYRKVGDQYEPVAF